MGFVDDDGYLYVCDRAADMVISGGVNIYPAEIEAVLVLMPGVRDCAVFGIPDEEFGESLAAAVQTEAGVVLSPRIFRLSAGKNRELQGTAGDHLPRRAAARGKRQDLQAAPAGAVLGKDRAPDLGSGLIGGASR
jgi:acyl-CoA synthetase (AMP-forming)/AMP-acid ligase II